MRGHDGTSVTGRIEHPASETPTDPDPPDEIRGSLPTGYRHRERPGSWTRFFRELPGVILLALILAVLIKTFLLQAFFIPSPSMLPTLEIDDRVLVSKVAYRFNGPEAGDLIVFDSPFFSDDQQEPLWEKAMRNVLEAVGVRTARVEDLIKRVVAVGGDRLEIRDNRVLVNDVPPDEPYLALGYRMQDLDPFYVPASHVWVMGDNRDNSQDSRRFGPIPVEGIIGRAFVRIWPVTRWESL